MTRRALALTALLALGAGLAPAQDPPPGTEPAPPPATEPAPPATEPAPPAPPGPGAAPPAPAGQDAFPLDERRRWSYLLTSSFESEGKAEEPSEHRLEVYMAEPQVVDGKPVTVLEWKLDGDLAQREYYVVEEGAVRCVKRIHGYGEHMKDYAIEPAQDVARRGMAPGTEWTWTGKVGPTAGRATVRVLRTEAVKVPAGTFEALVVQYEFDGEDESKGKTTRWLAPGLGIVREVSEVRTANTVFKSEAVLSAPSAPPPPR